jgi:hypothetical protein
MNHGFISYPIAIMSFDRPHYLEPVLQSLRQQTIPVAAKDIYLFQDGYQSDDGPDITDPTLVERCVAIFEEIFPHGKIIFSQRNLGVALNFARAEQIIFEKLGHNAAFFFEDDLIVTPHYLAALYDLTDIALAEPQIAYVAAYGDHHATLDQQRSASHKLIQMRHKWGFGLTRRQWLAQKDGDLQEPRGFGRFVIR